MGISFKTLASVCLVLMALLHFLHVVAPVVSIWLSGLLGWFALISLLWVLPWRSFTQFMVLGLVGLGFLVWGLQQGASWSWQQLLAQNNGLLVMLFSVSFLRLVALPQQQQQALPVGRAAFFKTLFGVHLLGAVINLSILVLVAGRYQANGVLNRATISLIGQAFAVAALWSPFFAAMGVALHYAPGAPLLSVMSTGGILSLLALIVITVLAGGWRLEQLDHFPGYPLQVDSLLIPSVLALVVLAAHSIWPDVTILTLVSVTSIGVVLLVLAVRASQGLTGFAVLKQHVLTAGERMARELSLFLGAGLLTIGLQAALQYLPATFIFQQFGAAQATLLLALAILASLLGVHPLISIAVTSQLILPLQPNLTLLAVLFLSMWSLGVVASPFSGMNVMLRSQFDLQGRDLFKWNVLFVVIMWLIISGLFATLPI